MDKVRIGIIGIGNMGSGHSLYLHPGEVSNAELTAICDIDPDRIKWARENLGENVRTFDSADDMMASGTVDAVIVATPHYLHPPLAIQAMNSGLHVLIEKPAGVYTKQVEEMNAVAEKATAFSASCSTSAP